MLCGCLMSPWLSSSDLHHIRFIWLDFYCRALPKLLLGSNNMPALRSHRNEGDDIPTYLADYMQDGNEGDESQ